MSKTIYEVHVWDNGYKEWHLNGKRHRVDGPAVEWADGLRSMRSAPLDPVSPRIDTAAVARAHNSMGAGYDELEDVWYPWIFAQIHAFIAKNLSSGLFEQPTALDVGSGTGFQSFLLARAGYLVTGFDLATELVEIAKAKTPTHADEPLKAPPLFRSSIGASWVDEHHQWLAARLESLRADRPIFPPAFEVADAVAWPYQSRPVDVMVCCGSVLSFVDDYEETIRSMARGVAPGGLLFVEVEQRLNADLLWPFVDLMVRGRLGYDQSLQMMAQNLVSRPGQTVRLEYPFPQSGGYVTLPMWLFSVKDLVGIFENAGLKVKDRIGIHQATNLIPSPVLHSEEPSRLLQRVFSLLRPLDGALARTWPFWRGGCSVMFCLERPK